MHVADERTMPFVLSKEVVMSSDTERDAGNDAAKENPTLQIAITAAELKDPVQDPPAEQKDHPLICRHTD